MTAFDYSLTTAGLITHRLAETLPLPEPTSSAIEYWTARNGIFARAVRPGIRALIPIALCDPCIKGLLPLSPHLEITPRIPRSLFVKLYQSSVESTNTAPEPLEQLFHFSYQAENWQLHIPDQIQTINSCQALDSANPINIAVDVHSHPHTDANFSPQDFAAEVGFRIYGVIAQVLNDRPQIKLCVSMQRHCWEVPAQSVFDIDPTIVEDRSTSRFYYNNHYAH